MRSRGAASCGVDWPVGKLSMAGGGTAPASESALRFHTHTTAKVPTVASRKTAMGTIQAALSKPPRIGAARIVAPYFASNQLRIIVSVLLVSSWACNSEIMTGEEGQLTWLHSSSTCPHPQEQIISWPSLSKRDLPAPSMTVVTI